MTAALPALQPSAYAALGPAFAAAQPPMPLPDPYWVGRSTHMARELGLTDDWWGTAAALAAVSGNAPWPGAQPVATVYSGHQFGHWAGRLGDGRALLLGARPSPDGAPLELQLKGSGLTPFSRMGDGRAVLRSSIREFLASEAMHALGIPTTRALCVIGSHQPVQREHLETAAVVTRVAPSFVRFGHFEHFSHHGQHAELKTLADHVIAQFYPDCAEQPQPYVALLQAVMQRTATLLAQWQAVGFMHGVLNTDNMSILGLTIDYGPFQFMDGYDPQRICNHSDRSGRYAYARQPQIAYWNLFALAQALLPLIDEPDDALAALEPFHTLLAEHLHRLLAARLGFPQADADTRRLALTLLALMARERTDHPLLWRRLALHMAGAPASLVTELFRDPAAIDHWLLHYQELSSKDGRRPDAELMLKSSPAFVLRNHLAEQAIARAQQHDFSAVDELLTVLQQPFDDHPQHAHLAGLPPDWAAHIQLSCSS